MIIDRKAEQLLQVPFPQQLQNMDKSDQIDSCKHTIKFRDFRHAFASLMLQNGVSLLKTSRLLWHTDTSITADYYATITEQQEKRVQIVYLVLHLKSCSV